MVEEGKEGKMVVTRAMLTGISTVVPEVGVPLKILSGILPPERYPYLYGVVGVSERFLTDRERGEKLVKTLSESSESREKAESIIKGMSIPKELKDVLIGFVRNPKSGSELSRLELEKYVSVLTDQLSRTTNPRERKEISNVITSLKMYLSEVG